MSFENIAHFFRNLNIIIFVLLYCFICIILSLFFDCVLIYLPGDLNIIEKSHESNILILNILKFVLLGPFLETFIFQHVPFSIFRRIFKNHKSKTILILFSGIIFGISHIYSLYYIIKTFILGMLFMYAYIIRYKNKDAFISVFLIHALFNLTIFIFNFYK